MRNFTVPDVAPLLANIFHPSLKGNTKHIPWINPANDGVFSQKWFKRLWQFLQHFAKPEQNEEQVSLKALGEWPVIPTTCGKLVTINNAKTVLDLTESGTETAMEKKVRKFLQHVKCATLNKDITCEGSTATASSRVLERKTAVTDPYVAHPHHVADVLQVLNYKCETEGLDVSTLRAEEIHEFLLFVQSDYDNLDPKEYFNEILKTLPLHKALNSSHVSLSAFPSYALVPAGVPLIEFDKLQRDTDCLFLNSDALPALQKLYKQLGTGAGRTVSEFYTDYILPHFHIFSQQCQMEHLVYIRDKVFPRLPTRSNEKREFVRVLKETACLPGQDGNLHHANEFYDPNNDVFKIMLKDFRFPPPPFNEPSWRDLLQEIGLQKDVSEELFLEFCTIVAEVASRSPSDPLNAKRSKVLVEHLFVNHLRRPEFLSAVSTIKFVASEKVDANLATIHQQYQCEEDELLPFIQFRDSIPWNYKNIVWTSAPLLPSWVQPNQTCQSLGVLKKPTYNMVINHLKNISFALVKKSTLPPSVKSIMNPIYSFLATYLECTSKEATDECTNVCKEIGRRLKTVPCILVKEGKVLVMGKQLAFKLPDNDPLSPFLYKVPREYGTLEHFLKRLGVTEMIKLSQLANVFKIMKDQCNEEQLSSDYEEKAKYAMYMLFELVVKRRSVELLDELYLPSEEKRLVNSNQLVCNVPPRLSEVAKSHYQVLLKLEKCKLDKIPENDYIDALQEELRPVKLESLVREEIDPSCRNSRCQHVGLDLVCDFQRKYANLLSSEEFLNGVERLIKHQKSSNLSHGDRNRLERLRSPQVQIKCIGMESIKIHLVDRNTQEVLEGTYLEDICYVVKENVSWSLYMQHGMPGLGILSMCVNKILDFCIQQGCMVALIDMLSCSSPSQIASTLNRHNITEVLSEDDREFIPPDDGWIPEGGEADFTMETGAAGGGGHGGGHGGGGHGGGGHGGSGYGGGGHGGGGYGGGGYGGGARGYRGGGYGGGGFIYDGDPNCFFPANPDEARRWIRQSNSDLEAAKFLYSPPQSPFNALTCFLSQQIVEKSLKAVMYAECGITGKQLNTHDVHQLANDVSNGTGINRQVVDLADRVKSYYLSTRYPNRQPAGRVPAEAFDQNEARRALEATTELLEIVETYIDQ